MIVIPAADQTLLVGQYVAEKTGCTFEPGMYQAMAVLDDTGAFCAGVIFSEYRGHDCQLSTAAETPMAWRDRVVHAVFDYVFNQLGCVRCTALSKKSNKRSRAFLEGLGFVLEGRIRRGFDGVKDAIIYGMLREECRYIQELETDGSVFDSEEAPASDPAESAEIKPVSAATIAQPAEATGVREKEFW